MPAKVKKSGSNFIVIDANTGRKISTSGRFKSRTAAQRQANAINTNIGGGSTEGGKRG